MPFFLQYENGLVMISQFEVFLMLYSFGYASFDAFENVADCWKFFFELFCRFLLLLLFDSLVRLVVFGLTTVFVDSLQFEGFCRFGLLKVFFLDCCGLALLYVFGGL